MRPKGQPTAQGIMSSLGTRLRKARKLRRLSQTELAKQIGTSSGQLSMIENGQSGTSLRAIVAAASALNVSLDYLAGLVDNPTSARDLAYELRKSEARVYDLQDLTLETWKPIEVIDIETGAGADVYRAGQGVESMIHFPSGWLRQKRLHAKYCRLIRITDKAMEPALPEGTSVLVDLSRTVRREDSIYVMRSGNKFIVRRAARDGEGRWLLTSDNRDKDAFPAEPWPEDATIIGEVMWGGQSFR